MDNRRLCQDFLSDLPLSVIESILMLVPIRDAIRTSILSTKWRFRWARIPQVSFDQDEICLHLVSNAESKLTTYAAECQFHFDSCCLVKKFVSRTLFSHEGNIHKFRLVSRIDSCPETDQWLFFLSRKDIKELILQHDSYGFFDVPYCLYSYGNLTFLELCWCEFGPPPSNFQGFLWLKSLILRNVEVPSNTIETIVARSPLLESLTLEYTDVGTFMLRISAPNLKYFCLVCIDYPKTILCAPLLAKMSVSLEAGDDDDFEQEPFEQEPLVCNYTKFFGGVANLESLNVQGNFTKDNILVLVRLIMDASANLRELQITTFSDEDDESKTPGIHVWDSECPKNCTFGKLKVIKMSGFHGGINEMKFIKLLLQSSPVLETMTVEQERNIYDTLSKKRLLNLVSELRSYCPASSNAKILFKNS